MKKVEQFKSFADLMGKASGYVDMLKSMSEMRAQIETPSASLQRQAILHSDEGPSVIRIPGGITATISLAALTASGNRGILVIQNGLIMPGSIAPT